jgi:hypothetical protein
MTESNTVRDAMNSSPAELVTHKPRRPAASFLSLVFVSVLFAFVASQTQSLSSTSEAKAFVNGRWFTGGDFEARTFYAVDGFLTVRKPTGPVRIIDLHEGFVVPPFGDAHNHSPGSKHDFADANRAFLDAGVFYVLNPGGNAESANSIRDQLGTPSSIDAMFAHALFTCHGGHPKPIWSILSIAETCGTARTDWKGGSLTRSTR